MKGSPNRIKDYSPELPADSIFCGQGTFLSTDTGHSVATERAGRGPERDGGYNIEVTLFLWPSKMWIKKFRMLEKRLIINNFILKAGRPEVCPPFA